MKKLLFLTLLCAAFGGSLFAQGQNFPGSGSGSAAQFNFANYGAVDDDSTDNCANGAVAAFTTAVNAYAGPGVPNAIIPSSNKAYKLATSAETCKFAFTNAKGVAVHLWGNIDCAQTAASCIQIGAVSTPGAAPAYASFQSYSIDGFGSLLGGANLTVGSSGQSGAGGIYVEPQVTNFYINGIKFWGTGAAPGFGPTVATLGNNCNAWSIFIDYPVADGVVTNVYDSVNATNSTVGGCGMANPNGATLGSNTVSFTHNVIGTAGFVGGTGNCGSMGILDGGTLGTLLDNLIYGFGMDVRLQGLGHRIQSNEADAANCSAKGVSAIIHVGINGSATPITQVMVSNNIVQVGTGHTTNFLALAGDTTCPAATCLQDWQITGNVTNLVGSGPLIAGTPACVPHNVASGCYIGGNQNFTIIPTSTSAVPGWTNAFGFVGSKSLTAQTANIGSTLVINATSTHTYLVGCQVVSTNTPTGATLPACNLSYTDLNSSAAATPAVTSTASTSAAGTVQSGTALVTITSGGAINFTTTGYAAGSGTALQYTVNVFVYTYGP